MWLRLRRPGWLWSWIGKRIAISINVQSVFGPAIDDRRALQLVGDWPLFSAFSISRISLRRFAGQWAAQYRRVYGYIVEIKPPPAGLTKFS